MRILNLTFYYVEKSLASIPGHCFAEFLIKTRMWRGADSLLNL